MTAFPGFRLVASVVADNLNRVNLTGEVDFSCAEALTQSLLLFDGMSIEVDLSDVTFIDAGALGALIKVKETLKGQGCDLYITGARGIVQRVPELVGPDGWAGVIDDEDAQQGSLQ